jgi:phosphoribosylformylglycinamidine cyclo-ligase
MGRVEEQEMFRVFNMGIGMIVIASEKETPDVMDRLEIMGEKAYILGSIEKRRAYGLQVMLT